VWFIVPEFIAERRPQTVVQVEVMPYTQVRLGCLPSGGPNRVIWIVRCYYGGDADLPIPSRRPKVRIIALAFAAVHFILSTPPMVFSLLLFDGSFFLCRHSCPCVLRYVVARLCLLGWI
jgi:hypothetical protein